MAKSKKKQTKEPKEEVFHVECILAARVESTGDWWGGYDDEENSWEPASGVANCQALLKKFWAHVGTDNEDYHSGYEIHAKESWIRHEKAQFKKKFGKEIEREQALDKKTEDDFLPQTKFERKKISQKKNPSLKGKGKQKARRRSQSTLSSDSDRPLFKKLVNSQPGRDIKGKGKQKENSTVPDENNASSLFSDKELSPDIVSGSRVEKDASSKPDLYIQTAFTSKEPHPTPPSPPQSAVNQTASEPTPDVPQVPTPTTAQASTSTIPQKQTHLPSYKVLPRIQMIDIPVKPDDFSGISVKQRLSQSALTPTNPQPSSKPPLPSRKDSTLSKLSFKRTPTVPPAVPNQHITASSRPSITVPKDNHASIQLSISHSPRATFSTSPSDYLMHEAEDLLQSIMPPELAAPLETTADKPSEPMPVKIPKIWKWAGDMFCLQGKDYVAYGRVSLTDATPVANNGMPLSIAFPATVTSLQFGSMYHAADVSNCLSSWMPVSQFARLVPLEHTERLTTLSKYMEKHCLVAVSPTKPSFEETIESHVLYFPATSPIIKYFSGVPISKNIETLFFVAILARRHNVFKDQPKYIKNAQLQHALRTLRYPPWLHDLLSSCPRDYCVWYDDDKQTMRGKQMPFDLKGGNLETYWLATILEQYKGVNKGYKADVEVIFVHIGAVKILHKVGALVERRAKRPDIHFVTFGTHQRVRPERWGFRRIYPVGGIMTFTPKALVEDPLGIHQRVSQISENNNWEAYIMPAVLGMAVHMHYKNRDALEAFDKGDFLYDYLLTAIDEGKVSFMCSPPTSSHPVCPTEPFKIKPFSERRFEEPVHEWLIDQGLIIAAGPRQILEHSIREFRTKYANKSEDLYPTLIQADLSQDLWYMQQQPAIMDRYRRFIALKGELEKTSDRYGVEWSTTSTFDYKDNFCKYLQRNA
ncbi:hypothetical protein IW261DRAFT_1505036 [Armillaria novae-zelandiae]|uniref:Chromo domain-containing protein n=1 Tax=Armillaria novae-zelandiae TaxID=153914 RepID=A0AA39T989_9AGAR|nr:hypothetical protein IW261DRAFT_1505036 [Armillaria novae-zelandiae]